MTHSSQRELCERLGITIGTMTKYLRCTIEPFKVGLGIQRRLAKELGVTLDALVNYYESGDYATEVTLEDVESWIRSSAGQADMPVLMKSMSDAAERALADQQQASPKLAPYLWPMEELKRASVSDAMRERLGLDNNTLKALVNEGHYDEETVEAFALVTGHATAAVRAAFTGRKPVEAP